MKTMKFSTLLLFFFCIVFHQQLNAQGLHYNASAVLDTGNITATINSNGLLFSKVSINAAGNTTNLLPGFEVPKGSNTHATFAADLWIGGLDDLGQLHVAASTYRQLGDDFFRGRLIKVAQRETPVYGIRFGKLEKQKFKIIKIITQMQDIQCR